MYDTVIRSSVRLRESPAVGLPIQEHAPASRAAADFAALAEEVCLDKQVDLPVSDGVPMWEAPSDALGLNEPGERLGSH
jgi:hypothetical protein